MALHITECDFTRYPFFYALIAGQCTGDDLRQRGFAYARWPADPDTTPTEPATAK
jgi:hypothetical protein